MTIIEPATRHDLPGLVDLLEEMDQFYGDTTEGTPEERVRQLTAVLFGPTPKAAALLAKDDDQVVGPPDAVPYELKKTGVDDVLGGKFPERAGRPIGERELAMVRILVRLIVALPAGP